MTPSIRLVVQAFVGGAIGAGVVVIGVLSCFVLAFFGESMIAVPGVIRIWTTEQDDALALNFDPDFVGMGLVVLAIAAGFVAIAAVRMLARKTSS